MDYFYWVGYNAYLDGIKECPAHYSDNERDKWQEGYFDAAFDD